MRRSLAVILMILLTVTTAGCLPFGQSSLDPGESTSSEKAETTGKTSEASTSAPEGQTETVASDNDQPGQDAYQMGDPITEQDYTQIDWNLAAYSNYFCVESGPAVIHYWNGGETILAYFTDILMYVSASEGKSVTVDLKTGYTSEGHGGMPIPEFGQSQDVVEIPTQVLAYMGTENFEGQDTIVFSADVEGGTASYFINKASMKCMGWQFVTSEGTVTYHLSENAVFEDVVDSIFESANDPLPEDSDEEPDYHDSDGDGFSDWNEDRPPTQEELGELTAKWQHEGMSEGEYIARLAELFNLNP